MSRLVDLRLVRGRDGAWRGKSPDADPHVWEVTECSDCPLRTDGWCCRPAAYRPIIGDGWQPDIAPDWCPLRQGPTVVMLAE